MNALEALIGSIGIAVVGWVSIPLVAGWAGVQITIPQAMQMSAGFFVLRFLWLWGVRTVFGKMK